MTIGLGIGDYSDGQHRGRGRLRRGAGPRAAPRRPAGRLRLRHPHRGGGRRAGCRARRAACPSGTSSTRPRSTAASTSSPPATTSTTRRPCCSATCCTGRPSTSAASSRSCRRGTGSPARSSRSSAWASARRPPTACCGASTTSSTSARWPRATATSRYKEALNAIEAGSPGTKHAFYFEFLDKAADRFRPEAAEAQEGLQPVPVVRGADHRRGVRLLPAGRARGRRRAGAGRAAAQAAPQARARRPAPIGRQ